MFREGVDIVGGQPEQVLNVVAAEYDRVTRVEASLHPDIPFRFHIQVDHTVVVDEDAAAFRTPFDGAALRNDALNRSLHQHYATG